MKKTIPYIAGAAFFLVSPLLWIIRGKYLNYLGLYPTETINAGPYEMYSFLYVIIMFYLATYTIYNILNYLESVE